MPAAPARSPASKPGATPPPSCLTTSTAGVGPWGRERGECVDGGGTGRGGGGGRRVRGTKEGGREGGREDRNHGRFGGKHRESEVLTGAVSKTLSTRRARGLRAATAPSAVHPWPPTSLFTRSMLLRLGALHSLSDVLPARKVNSGLRRLDNLGWTTAYARVEFSGRRALSPRREQDSSSAPEGREGRADRNDTVLMSRSHSKHHLKPLP